MNLSDRLEDFRKSLNDELKETKLLLPLSDKQIKDCLMEQIEIEVIWQDVVADASDLYYEAEHNAETIFSRKFNEANKNAQAILTASELKHEANADVDYSEAKKLQNKAYGLKKRAEGMLKTVETRKYILKDMSALIINGTERFELR